MLWPYRGLCGAVLASGLVLAFAGASCAPDQPPRRPRIQARQYEPGMLRPETSDFLPSRDNLLSSSSFAEGKIEPWTFEFGPGAVGKVAFRNGLLCAQIDDKGTGDWAFSLHYPVIVRPHLPYELQFAAQSRDGALIKAQVHGEADEKHWSGRLVTERDLNTYRSGSFVAEGRRPSATIEFQVSQDVARKTPYTACIGRVIFTGPVRQESQSICLGTQLEPRSSVCDQTLDKLLQRTGLAVRNEDTGCDVMVTVQGQTFGGGNAKASASGHYYVVAKADAKDERFGGKAEPRSPTGASDSKVDAESMRCDALLQGMVSASFFEILGRVTGPDELLAIAKDPSGIARDDDLLRQPAIDALLQYGDGVGPLLVNSLADYLDGKRQGWAEVSACRLLERLPDVARTVAKAQQVLARGLAAPSPCMRAGARKAAKAMGQLAVLRSAIDEALAKAPPADEAAELQAILQALSKE